MVCLQSPSNCCHQNYLNRSSSRWLSPNNLTNMRLQLTYLFAFIIRSYLRGERAQSAEVKVRINVHKISEEILSNIINYFKLPRMRCPSSKSNYNHVWSQCWKSTMIAKVNLCLFKIADPGMSRAKNEHYQDKSFFVCYLAAVTDS